MTENNKDMNSVDNEEKIISKIQSSILERLYASGIKVNLSKEEKSQILSKIEEELQTKAKSLELELWDRMEKRINRRIIQIVKIASAFLVVFASALTVGGFITLKEIKQLTAKEVTSILVENDELRSKIVHAVAETLSTPAYSILDAVIQKQQYHLKQIESNTHKSNELIKQLDGTYDDLIKTSIKEFEDLLDVLNQVEKTYSSDSLNHR